MAANRGHRRQVRHVQLDAACICCIAEARGPSSARLMARDTWLGGSTAVKPDLRAGRPHSLDGLGVVLQGGGSMAEPSAPAADSDAAAASGSAGGGRVATVVLRASTDNLLDDLERAIDDGVNNYKVLSARVQGSNISRLHAMTVRRELAACCKWLG
jgi:hypothetical protein